MTLAYFLGRHSSWEAAIADKRRKDEGHQPLCWQSPSLLLAPGAGQPSCCNSTPSQSSGEVNSPDQTGQASAMGSAFLTQGKSSPHSGEHPGRHPATSGNNSAIFRAK